MYFQSDKYTNSDYKRTAANAKKIIERLERQKVLDKGQGVPLNEFLDMLISYKHTNQSNLAIAACISRNTIGDLMSGKNKDPDLATIMCICIGLHLDPELSYLLLRKAHLSVDENIVYRTLIEEHYSEDIVTWNYYLNCVGMAHIGCSNRDELEEKLADMKEEIKRLHN